MHDSKKSIFPQYPAYFCIAGPRIRYEPVTRIFYQAVANIVGGKTGHVLVERPDWVPASLPPKSIRGFIAGYGGQTLSRTESADGIEFRVVLP